MFKKKLVSSHTDLFRYSPPHEGLKHKPIFIGETKQQILHAVSSFRRLGCRFPAADHKDISSLERELVICSRKGVLKGNNYHSFEAIPGVIFRIHSADYVEMSENIMNYEQKLFGGLYAVITGRKAWFLPERLVGEVRLQLMDHNVSAVEAYLRTHVPAKEVQEYLSTLNVA